MLSSSARQKILEMSGRELTFHLKERHDLTTKQKLEIYKFWCDNKGVRIRDINSK